MKFHVSSIRQNISFFLSHKIIKLDFLLGPSFHQFYNNSVGLINRITLKKNEMKLS